MMLQAAVVLNLIMTMLVNRFRSCPQQIKGLYSLFVKHHE